MPQRMGPNVVHDSVYGLQGMEALDEVAAEGAQRRLLGHLAQPASMLQALLSMHLAQHAPCTLSHREPSLSLAPWGQSLIGVCQCNDAWAYHPCSDSDT